MKRSARRWVEDASSPAFHEFYHRREILMIKSVLVTGGAGYIGIPLVQELLAKGYAVTVLDKLLYGDQGLAGLSESEQLRIVEGDICTEADVEKAVEGMDAVVALAGIAGDAACQVNLDAALQINYYAHEMLLRICRKHKLQRLVYPSSCAVYAYGGLFGLVNEEPHFDRASFYIQTMISCERLYLRQPDLCSVILRLPALFGLSPRMRFDLPANSHEAKAAPGDVVEWKVTSEGLPLLHVRDAAHAFVLALEAPEASVRGQIFNVGSTSSLHTARQDQEEPALSFAKIKRVLDFEAVRTPEQGRAEMIEFISGNTININEARYHNAKAWEVINSKRFLPFAVPDVDEKEKRELLHTIDSGWLSTGPKTKVFENALYDYFQVDGLHCIPVSSCTAGLHVQLLAYGIGPGDEVITTPLTFCATIHTILQTGANPVLVDIDPQNYNIDVDAIEEKITPRTKAIVPVYYAGNALNYEKLSEVAARHNLLVLADAAHAMGAEYNNKKLGTFEDAAAFSFYATKNMTTGEGGLLTTTNEEAARRMRKIHYFGMDKDAWKRYSDSGSWFYEISEFGYKYNFTDVQAAFGLHQLEKIDDFNRRRNELCEIYDEAFAPYEELIIPRTHPGAYSTRHLYPLLIKTERLKIDRNTFIKKLSEAKIGTSVHFVPIPYHSYFQRVLGCKPGDFPRTDWFYEREISLPMYTKLTHNDIQRVITAVTDIVQTSV